MEKLNRGDKIYLDKEETQESDVNGFLDCRDGIVQVYEYNDESGYGAKVRLFLCQNAKHEVVAIVRQTWDDSENEWIERSMFFDSDSFVFLKALINGDNEKGKYSLIRNYGE